MERDALFARVLVPVDFSAASHEALALAVRVARRGASHLTLMHVYEPPSFQLLPDAIFVADPELMARQMTAVNEALERLRKETEAQGIPADTILTQGNASVEIIREANSGRPDLVIIGTHGHTALHNLFLGSVAERVVRSANCPVLTVRSKEHRSKLP